jgi:hypothetical protein
MTVSASGEPAAHFARGVLSPSPILSRQGRGIALSGEGCAEGRRPSALFNIPPLAKGDRGGLANGVKLGMCRALHSWIPASAGMTDQRRRVSFPLPALQWHVLPSDLDSSLRPAHTIASMGRAEGLRPSAFPVTPQDWGHPSGPTPDAVDGAKPLFLDSRLRGNDNCAGMGRAEGRRPSPLFNIPPLSKGDRGGLAQGDDRRAEMRVRVQHTHMTRPLQLRSV